MEDTGPGIAAEHQPHIFGKYFQVEEGTQQGIGLGLFIAKSIVEAHLGKISVSSPAGQGAHFHFSIPRWRPEICGEIPSPKDSAGLSPKTPGSAVAPSLSSILIVDDDEDLRFVMQEALVSHGYRVHAEASGETALKYLEDNQLSLIVVDHYMPGLKGAEFIKILRESASAARNTPILLSSADEHISQQASSLPIQAYLKKPVALHELLKQVERVIGQVTHN